MDISPEPVEKWQSVGDDRHNILESFYKDPQRYAYTFQNYVFFTRMLQVRLRVPRLPDSTYLIPVPNLQMYFWWWVFVANLVV